MDRISRDRIAIVEINPRMCGQFADLYEKVDGMSGYEVALALALGDEPVLHRRRGIHGAAASYPLRIFESMRIERAPSPALIASVEEAFPGTLVWSECETGDVMSDFESSEDGKSARYAVVNVGAEDRQGLAVRRDEVVRELGYRFASA